MPAIAQRPTLVRVDAAAPRRTAGAAWTFLTNHAHVLLCLAAEPGVRLRDVAATVGITERAVQHIVADLEAGGVVTRTRTGRRNRYAVDPSVPLRHAVEAHRRVGDLLALALPLPLAPQLAAAPMDAARPAGPAARGPAAAAAGA